MNNCLNNAAKNVEIFLEIGDTTKIEPIFTWVSKFIKKFNNFDNKSPNLFQSFSFSQFFTYKFTACFVCLFVLSCLQSCQGGYLFLSLSQSCQGWKFFSCRNSPPWTISTSRGIFNYKGLDIKLLNIKLLN